MWAGWGHASEKDLLPDTLEKTPTQIQFIGPRGAPMRALGDKIGSTIIAQSAGVSCIGWNGDQLRCDYKNQGFIPQATYDQANVTTVSSDNFKRASADLGGDPFDCFFANHSS